jgi:hypothetical protein
MALRYWTGNATPTSFNWNYNSGGITNWGSASGVADNVLPPTSSDDVIFDGTGEDFEKIKGLKEKCEALGYDTYMLFVNTSLEIALQRNAKRARTVKPDIVEKSWRNVQANIGKFQNLFGTGNMIVVDNDTFNEDVLNKVWKRIKGLMNQPIKNPIGKKWVKDELAAKKR